MTDADRLAQLRRLVADNLIRALAPVTEAAPEAPPAASAAYLTAAMRFLKENAVMAAPAAAAAAEAAPALPELPPLETPAEDDDELEEASW